MTGSLEGQRTGQERLLTLPAAPWCVQPQTGCRENLCPELQGETLLPQLHVGGLASRKCSVKVEVAAVILSLWRFPAFLWLPQNTASRPCPTVTSLCWSSGEAPRERADGRGGAILRYHLQVVAVSISRATLQTLQKEPGRAPRSRCLGENQRQL